MKFKKFLTLIFITFSLLLLGCGKTDSEPVAEADYTVDDIYISTRFSVFRSNNDGVVNSLDFGCRIENYTFNRLSLVKYDVVIFDKNGNEIKRINSSLNLQDTYIKSKSHFDFERTFSNLDIYNIDDPDELTAVPVITDVIYTKDMNPVSELELVKATDTLDGVTVTLNSVKASYEGFYGIGIVPDITITNNSDKDLANVNYLLILFDNDGNELLQINRSYNGVDESINSGESYRDNSGKSTCFVDTQACKVTVKLVSYEDTEVMPLAVFPAAGDYLYKSLNNENMENISSVLPTSIDVCIDNSGNVNLLSISDPGKIKEAVDLFTAIKIKGDGMCVTDAYNTVTFCFSDGSSCNLSLPGNYLEIGTYGEYRYYEMENFDAFWKFVCKS